MDSFGFQIADGEYIDVSIRRPFWSGSVVARPDCGWHKNFSRQLKVRESEPYLLLVSQIRISGVEPERADTVKRRIVGLIAQHSGVRNAECIEDRFLSPVSHQQRNSRESVAPTNQINDCTDIAAIDLSKQHLGFFLRRLPECLE